MAGHSHSIHTFNPVEAVHQKMLASYRQRLLRPLLILLQRAHVRPDHVSLLSVFCMFLLPLGFFYSLPYLVLAAYLGHLFLDAVDGSLARHLDVVSERGAYVDVVVDHFSLLMTLLTLQWFAIGDAFWLLLYTVTYILLIVHFVLMNVRGSPPPFPIIRTKYLLFLLVTLFAYGFLGTDFLNLFLKIAAVYYAVMVCIYVLIFRWSLRS